MTNQLTRLSRNPGIVNAAITPPAPPAPTPTNIPTDNAMSRGAPRPRTNTGVVPPPTDTTKTMPDQKTAAPPPAPAPAPDSGIIPTHVTGTVDTRPRTNAAPPPPQPTDGSTPPPAAPTGSTAPPPLQVGSDEISPGVYQNPTMTFARQNDPRGASTNFATPKTGRLAGLNDDQLFTLIAYGTDPALKTEAMNAAWQALGSNTGNYNAWINSFDGPKQVSLSGTDKIAALMQQLGAGGGAGAPGGTGGEGGLPGAGGTGGIVNAGTGAGGVPGQGGVGGNPLGPHGVAAPNPVLGQVTGDQTVQGQLASMLKTGSPVLDAARARAMQAANARGLQNASIAAQSGEEAIVNTATPIATADASTFQRQALTNQDVQNQFLSQGYGAALDLNKQYEAFMQQGVLQDKDNALKKYINDTGNSTQEKVAAMQIAANQANVASQLDNALKLAGIQADTSKYGVDQQVKFNLTSLQQNALSSYSAGLTNIMGSSMEPDAKLNFLRNYNAVWAGNPNLPIKIDMSLFPPPAAPAGS